MKLPNLRLVNRVGLVSLTAWFSLLVALSGGAALLVMVRQQLAIETEAQRIYDVTMAKSFETTRILRSLERLAGSGRVMLSVTDAAERRVLRQQLESIAMDGSLQGNATVRSRINGALQIIDRNLEDLEQQGASARRIALVRWEPAEQMLFDTAEAIGAEASTLAADQTDSIIATTKQARMALLGAGALLIVGSVVGFLIIYLMITRPVVRLSRSLKLAREGYLLPGGHEVVRELQVLDDAAVALAQAHRELDVARSELNQLVNTDAATGPSNRRHFFHRGNEELSRSERYGSICSAAVFDIDDFATLRQRLGSAEGDALLQQLGTHLQRICRQVDITARTGAGQFAALMPHTTAEVAQLAAERLRREIAQFAATLSSGEELHCTVSVGVAGCGEAQRDIEVLLRSAEKAAQQAAAAGGNRVARVSEANGQTC